MATVTWTPASLRVELTRGEKVAGLLRDLEVPRTAVTDVGLVDDALAAVRGLRAPGLALPGRRKVGTWRGRGRTVLVSVRAGEPAVRIALAGERYDELLLSHADAASWAAGLRRA